MASSRTQTNAIFDMAAGFVLHTACHVFLTGKAGTGKTTFLKHIREHTSKKTAVVAPTGVAAINAGGVTLHSFFQLPFGAFVPESRPGGMFSLGPAQGTDLNTILKNIRVGREKRKLFEELELLIIDEVSMMRADLLDAVDGILRYFRRKPDVPFGGVQVLYIGDLHQLPPVVKDDEWSMLSAYYRSLFFFDARVMEVARPLYIELEQVYRQRDDTFIQLLNSIRNGIVDEDGLRLLNRRYDPSFHPEPEDGYIILTSHNYKADKINNSELARLQAEVHTFDAELSGEFNEQALPAARALVLKVGAQVMFIRNDKGEQRRYYNGRIARVSRIKGTDIYVRFPDDHTEMQLEKETWRNIRYRYDEQADRVEEEELGSFRQYPVRLAWAITIHKSQGLTFEKAIVDAGTSFAPGQVYVALSRLTSMSGLVLSSEITQAALHTDERIMILSDMRMPAAEMQRQLQDAQRVFIGDRLAKSYSWESIAVLCREFHEAHNGRRVPDQESAVAWSAFILRSVAELVKTGARFRNQLAGILSVAHQDHYQYLAQRVHAATAYFLPLTDVLLVSWQEHYEAMRVKGKVKKYLSALQLLYNAFSRKKYEISQAALLADGLARGDDPGRLLEQVAARPEVSVPVAGAGKPEKEKKESSKSISLELLQKGKGIEEIAKERNLAKSTIEGHLLPYIVTGEVALSLFVTKENEQAIRNAVLHSGQRQAGVIRSALGEAFSFTEIRAVLYHMENEEINSREYKK